MRERNFKLSWTTDGFTPGGALDGYAITATQNSNPVWLGHIKGLAVQVIIPNTGSPVGTLKLQGSCDQASSRGSDGEVPDANVVNWTDIAFQDSAGNWQTSVTIAGAVNQMFIDSDCMYRWVRLAITRTSGTITTTAKIQIKGQ